MAPHRQPGPGLAEPRYAELHLPVAATTCGARAAGTIYARRYGDPASRRKLLFIHGVGLSLATWRTSIGPLAGAADCVAIDLLGFGRSVAEPGSPAGLAWQTSLLEPLLDALRWRRVVVVGHSMGGGVALGAALHLPRRVAGLVLVASVAFPQPQPAVFRPLHLPGAPWVLTGLARTTRLLGLRRHVERGFGYDPVAAADYLAMLTRPRVAAAFVDAVRDLRPAQYHRFSAFFGALRQPVLVIHGDRDDIVPPSIAVRLQAALPNAELYWVRGGHHLPQETHPGPVAQRIREFLERVPS